MPTIAILKKIISVYFYVLCSGFVFWIIFFPISFATNKLEILNILKEYDLSTMNFTEFTIFMISGSVVFFIYLSAIYFLKKSLVDLSNKNYFSKKVIDSFHKSGKLILIATFCGSLFDFFVTLFISNKAVFKIEDSLFVSIIMGLFLLFLSEVFEKARQTQEENDLTI